MNWKLRGFDTFEEKWYDLPGEYPSKETAEQAAQERLDELERTQPSATSGGQDRNGIQDRVYTVSPDGYVARFLGAKMKTNSSDNSYRGLTDDTGAMLMAGKWSYMTSSVVYKEGLDIPKNKENEYYCGPLHYPSDATSRLVKCATEGIAIFVCNAVNKQLEAMRDYGRDRMKALEL